jgi:hypothetical protein
MGTSHHNAHHTHDGIGLMTPPTTPQKSHLTPQTVLAAMRQHKKREEKHYSAPKMKAAMQEKTTTKKKWKKEMVVGATNVEPAWKKQKRDKKKRKKRERRMHKSSSHVKLVTPTPQPRREETTPESSWELTPDTLPSYSTFFPSADVDGEIATEEQRCGKKPEIQPGDEKGKYKHASPVLLLPESGSLITVNYSYDRKLQQYYDANTDLFTPQALAGPSAAHCIDETFSFLLALASEQSHLTSHTLAAEQRIRMLKKTKWKIDYPAIHRLEAVMDLESTLCFELMMEEYAFRDVMWENKERVGWNLKGALDGLKKCVGKMIDIFDEKMRELEQGVAK